MARIRFAEKDRAEGLVALARRIKVVCLPDDQYLIAEANLRLLDDLGLTYEVLAVEGFDSAVRKVRNTAAAKV